MPELAAGILRWIGLLGLMGLAGPAILDGWILRGRPGLDPGPGHARRSRRLAVTGGLLLAASALAAAVVAAWELTQARPASLGRFLVGTHAGRAALIQAAVGLAGAVLAWRCWPGGLPAGRTWVLVALAAVAAVVWNSHAGIRGGSALVVDGLHVAAVALWIGGLLRLALLDWRALEHRGELGSPRVLAALIRRFSDLGALAVLATAVSGILAARRNLYGADALIRSPYGQALLAKLALVAVLLAIAAVNLFALRPWLERAAGAVTRRTGGARRRRGALGGAGAWSADGPGRDAADAVGAGHGAGGAGDPPPAAGRRPAVVVRRLVRAEAVAAVAVLLASGILAVLPPADRPAAATEPVTWRAEVGGEPVELALQPGQRGAVTLSARSLGRVPLARGLVRLDMPEHPMGLYQIALSPPADRGAGSTGTLEARAVLPMPGLWRLTWTLALENGAQATVTTDFEAAGAPGNQRQGRLSLRAAFQSTGGAIQATVALLGLVEAAALVAIGWRRLWPIPFGAGLIALALAAWLLGQVAWIDAYPTTYVPNPLPDSPAVVAQGRRVYETHCAACHGPEGRGDGPAAAGMLPPPADLTGVHVRQHTDGDLYWWITHGIEGTAMPAFEDVLTEEERWAVIRFIRRLDPRDR
ncbi:c-type cytochrome [Thermaerobacter sp. FW80]|uniref:CopD family protein n=1 Tax=Thermaerobacter sp. FW80 TaxID=2546351 RepID=UPI001075016A|nr:CopD family protein [Thermaerobacter sp. FW80]QBS36779.1 c-type cytochrome [Thermaerobacter sp. FW80]